MSRATNVSSTEDDIEHFTARVAGERLDRRHQLAGFVQTVVDVEGIDFHAIVLLNRARAKRWLSMTSRTHACMVSTMTSRSVL